MGGGSGYIEVLKKMLTGVSEAWVDNGCACARVRVQVVCARTEVGKC
jgi:hypothetical protein